MFEEGKIVKRGTFLYGKDAFCDVCIQQTDCRYGSGDYEDPPEYQNDLEGVWFYVWYSTAGNRAQFNSGGGVYSTIEEAMSDLEKKLAGLQWLE